MHLYRTSSGILLMYNSQVYTINMPWTELINRNSLYKFLQTLVETGLYIGSTTQKNFEVNGILAPTDQQEVWAAGVTYLKSRDARVEESKSAGMSDSYEKVYNAERPELFFKSSANRVVGHLATVNIREDSSWNVPEPELTLFINSHGNIEGYCIGNDMSSRSIEGENPLYLPQAKMYEGSAALGPCIYISPTPIDTQTMISIEIIRDGIVQFNGTASISQMKRSLTELVSYLFRCYAFPHGVFLMTGTCLVPPNDFTLLPGDVVNISITGIGTLSNTVAIHKIKK